MSTFRGLSKSQWPVIRAFCNNDLDAGRRTIAKYAPAIRSFISKRGYERQVDDFEQQTYMRIVEWVNRDGFDPAKSHFRSMVLTCILGVIAEEMRKLGRRPREESLEDHPAVEPVDRLTWDEVYYENIRTQALAEVRRRVEVETWSAFEALHGGQSADDVAAAFGRDKQWVSDLKSRLLKMYRDSCLELDHDAI